jgi:hypothetical protein
MNYHMPRSIGGLATLIIPVKIVWIIEEQTLENGLLSEIYGYRDV